MVTVMYCTVERQYSIGACGEMPSAVSMVTVGVQLAVWKGMLSSLTSRGVMELQGRLYTDTAPDEIYKGLQMLEICKLNCLPTVSCSLKTTLMMLGLTTCTDSTCGGVPVTAIEVTREDTVNWKLPEMVKRKVESGVGTATPMLKEMSSVETVTPGVLAFCALMDTIFMRLLLRSQKKSCPMFQFSSCITPVPLITYISKLSDTAPIEGKLSLRITCREYSVPAESTLLKDTTTVRVLCMLGLSAVTAVALMVRGLGVDDEAVLRLMQVVEVMEVLRRVQVEGVMVEGKTGSTIMRQEVVSMGLVSWKVKMKLEGEDSVFGEAMMGAVGTSVTARESSRQSTTVSAALWMSCLISLDQLLQILQRFIFYHLSSITVIYVPTTHA